MPRKKVVKIADWRPDSGAVLQYPPAFIDWINSINSGFLNQIKYEPFELYKQQAAQWLAETDSIEDCETTEERSHFVGKEKAKSRANCLYACNKYLYLKEALAVAGKNKFIAWPVQEIIFFLIDCGYSLMIGKPRQIGGTSGIAGASMFKASFTPNYFTKFITTEGEKLEEIFDDKFKYAYEQLPMHMSPTVGNYRDNMVNFFAKIDKGKHVATGGKILVSPPRYDAINGGSPNLTLIDEIGLIKNFGAIMREGRPTLSMYNPITERLEVKRQVIMWGTGGQMDKAGAVFESEWNSCKKNWIDRNHKYGIIPIFFDAYAKPGVTPEYYSEQKSIAYSVEGHEAEKARVQFHQAYPLTEEDMFLRSSKYIMPVRIINEHLSRISESLKRPLYGYLDAIYDQSRPYEGDKYLPFAVTAVLFRETSGWDDPRTTTIIWNKPDRKFKNRFFKGTDPISSETGHSDFATAIWDAHENTIAAVTALRGYSMQDDTTGLSSIKESFREAILLNIYYGGIPELVEANAGLMYIDYMDTKKMGRLLTGNMALPRPLQTPTARKVGLYNSAKNSKHIIDELIEMLDIYANDISIPQLFRQLKNFSEKELTNGKVRYQAEDLNFHKDDIIFACAFAYICWKCFPNRRVEQPDGAPKKKMHTKLTYDSSWNLVRSVVDENGRVRQQLPKR